MATAHPVEKHEGIMADHETRIQSLEKGAAVREEQYRNLYISIGKIEKSVEMIQQAVEKLKDKPRKKWESLETIVVTAIATGVIGFMVGKVIGA